jgi:NAD(P)-dependent dehydrogenase (short-subunit alcohol dehydrogenase family)
MTNHIVTSRAIVVTGASGGIGRVLVQKLAAKNFTVFAAARCVDQPTDRIKSQPAGGRIVPLPLDVTDEKSIAQFVEEISVYAGKSGIAGLVNNAGVMVQGPLELVAPNDFRLQFDVNVVGPFSLTRALLPLLRLGRDRSFLRTHLGFQGGTGLFNRRHENGICTSRNQGHPDRTRSNCHGNTREIQGITTRSARAGISKQSQFLRARADGGCRRHEEKPGRST